MGLHNQETEKFYSDLFSLTSKPEWETFKDYCEELLKGKVETALDIDTIEELHRSKGQAEILRMIVSFRDILEAQYEYIQEEEEQAYEAF